jgi:Zn-dependent membrane protease YugP
MDYILYFAAIGVVLWAQYKVKNAYKHYATVQTENHINGATVARRILESKGLSHVAVQVSQNGVLSDHFDPKSNTVNLSPKVYNDSTIASVAVAAHEVGHAIQYAEKYNAIAIRNTLLPVAIISGHLGWIVAIIGLMASIDPVFWLGIAMLGVIAAFQLVTLPIEFDASKRALAILGDGGYISSDEVVDAKAMLSAAAFTYVAALVATLMQIMRLVMLANRRRN